MKQISSTSRIVGAACALIALVVWIILPVLSFNVIIPLFSINGFVLAFRFNQLMIVTFILPVLMIVAALMGNKTFSVIMGVLDLILAVVIVILKKDIILHGNLNWLYSSASLLLNKVAEAANLSIDQSDMNTIINIACDNYLMPGFGFWIHVVVVLVFITVMALSREVSSGNSGRAGSNGTTYGQPHGGSTTYGNTTYGSARSNTSSGSTGSFTHHT